MLILKNLFKHCCNGQVTKLKDIKLDNNFNIVFKNLIDSKYNISKLVYYITLKIQNVFRKQKKILIKYISL